LAQIQRRQATEETFMESMFKAVFGDGLASDSQEASRCVDVGIFEQRVVTKALELAEGQPAEANLVPYLNIVREATRLGLDLSRKR
jgi:hypothetical protein